MRISKIFLPGTSVICDMEEKSSLQSEYEWQQNKIGFISMIQLYSKDTDQLTRDTKRNATFHHRNNNTYNLLYYLPMLVYLIKLHYHLIYFA